MIKVLFVCHGNICRSPMAEFVMRDMVSKAGLDDEIEVASSATSDEEIGNEVHSGARKKLSEAGISCKGKRARQINVEDIYKYDYIVTMETYNSINLYRRLKWLDATAEELNMLGKKVYRLLDFTDNPRNIADPWYTGDFDTAYNEIVEGCTALLAEIRQRL